ncbi:MAG: Glycine reductase complex selenoprotein [Synergistaceae bacterium]|jgi:hypothetical protein|nr:MAG: hypothetical protein XD68_0852 [Synergistales bacterium 54_24]MBC7078302.1 hypothetical protein [Synergistales bacterium]MDI3531698.1 Glycine reductase complex selenoprotein [Synergistaceae bacterium]HAF50074.1 hypothetical protein [Synergistaceae bacterium]
MKDLCGKKLMLLGDSDGVASPLMEECFAGEGEVVFSATECFL